MPAIRNTPEGGQYLHPTIIGLAGEMTSDSTNIELILYDKRIRGLDPYHPVRFEPGEAIPQDTFGYVIINLRPTSPDTYWFIHNIPRFDGEDVQGTVTYHTAGTRIVMRHGKVTACPSQVVRERIFDVTVYFSEFETVLLK